jgi:hypothetical protein
MARPDADDIRDLEIRGIAPEADGWDEAMRENGIRSTPVTMGALKLDSFKVRVRKICNGVFEGTDENRLDRYRF